MLHNSPQSPRVSICCITYNHADYIAEAMDGFLSQETDFDFEILVHDDASTDGTTEILDEYERLHPDIIRVFRETENQYRKNKYKGGYLCGLLVPAARGEYIAWCEGDDCWTSKSKLQSQVDYLDAHPECSESCHAARIVDGATGEVLGIMGMGKEECDLGVHELCRHWNVPSASTMMRKCHFSEYVEKWDFARPVGDFPLAVYFATKGRIHYDPEVRSVYRFSVPGSWTASQGSYKAKLSTAHSWIGMLESIDALTEGAWREDLAAAGRSSVHIIGTQQGLSHVRTPIGRKASRSLSLGERVSILAKRIFWMLGFVVVRDKGKAVMRRR